MHTKLTPELLALPGMKEAILRRAGIVKETEEDAALGHPIQMGANHFVQEFEINDYPREARWKPTQQRDWNLTVETKSNAITENSTTFS